MKPITLIIIFSLLSIMLKAQSVNNDTPKLQNSEPSSNVGNKKSINNAPVLSESSSANKNSNSLNKPELLNMSIIENTKDIILKVDSLKVQAKPIE